MSARAIPEGFHSVTPHFVVDSASAAIEFYKRAFGAEERMRMPGPDNLIMHAELQIGNSTLMVHDGIPGGPTQSPRDLGGTSCVLHIYTEDCDSLFERAIEAGAEAKMPPTDMFWGDRYSMVSDPFGHAWAIATHRENVSPEEIERRAAQLTSGGASPADDV